jgi:glyoxylase-like metal-dependent hydrolase (beta-lactamase superfamily II)
VEVAAGIHRVEAPLGDRYVSLYLLEGQDGLLLFDTGTDRSPQDALLPYLASIGRDPASIRWVVTSHADYDHFGGNRSVRELAPRAQFLCHDLDSDMVQDVDRLIGSRLQEFAPEHAIAETDETISAVRAGTRTVPVDLRVQGGERVRLDDQWSVEIRHAPGHSRGHLCILDERSRAALISDAILGDTLRSKNGAPAFPPTYRYVDTYLATIAAMTSWRPELLLTAHFPVLRGGDVLDFLGVSRAFAERLEAGLRRELSKSAAGVPTRELILSLAPELGDWSPAAALALAHPAVGHLERLECYGLVGRRSSGGVVTWHWAA